MKTNRINAFGMMLCLCILGIKLAAQGYGEIRGIIKDSELLPVPFATIKVLQGNQLIGGTQANGEGRYHYKPLNPGIYDIVVQNPEYQTQPVQNVSVKPNEATYVDVKLRANTLGTVEVVAKAVEYTPAGVDNTMFTYKTFTADELNTMAGYTKGDVKGALELMSSDIVASNDGQVHFRGSRGEASGFFVDGVRTLKEANVPGLSIENITVFSGGVPASYGDVTSGVVIITTKSYFSGIRDKNIRVAAERERVRESKERRQAIEDEENRKKEIEAEKAKEKQEKEAKQETGTKKGN